GPQHRERFGEGMRIVGVVERRNVLALLFGDAVERRARGRLVLVGGSQLETLDAAQLGAHESANFLLQSGIAWKVEGLGEAHDGRLADARLRRELRDLGKR